jgi:membrane-associated phospholipid phosphatase
VFVRHLLSQATALADSGKYLVKFQTVRIAQACVLCLACWAGLPKAAKAQNTIVESAIIPGERLSDWLVRNAGPNADTTSLQWQVQAERAPQAQLREATLLGLQQSPGIALNAQDRARLSNLLLALPLTGRLTVAIADARWLQAKPAQDPILQEGHHVVLPQRPTTVTVLTETGRPCTAAHVSGALIKDYLQACLGVQASSQVDWAWVAQADGRTTSFGIAPWNLTQQAEPSIGAWIWAPKRQVSIPKSVSDNLARFLATQLPGELALSTTDIQAVSVQQTTTPVPRDAQATASDWGEIGLLQTPTARMAAAGDVRLHTSHVTPYTSGTVMFQPFDWLETGFRYTNVANRLYGPEIAGGQSFKDKSIDLKLRLLKETNYFPQIALGLRDLGGTGLFSGEYVVGNKRWGNWDASLGLGWGYQGARANLKNPLSIFGSGFNSRPANDVGSGGTPGLKTMFRGPAAVFGGVQWNSPSNPWVYKIELDGNDYKSQPQNNNQSVKSPLNFGAVYRYSPSMDFSVGLERGNRLMLGFTIHGGLPDLYSPKLLDTPLPPIRSAAPAKLSAAGWGDTAKTIELFTGWTVRSISHQQITTTVVAETGGAIHLQERIDRAVTFLHRDAPSSSKHFVLQLQEYGLPMSKIDIDRAEWVAQNTQVVAPALRLPAQRVSAGQSVATRTFAPDDQQAQFWKGKGPGFNAEWGPSYNQILGGPDGFLLYQLGLQAQLEQRFSDSTWLSSSFNLRLLDNYEKFVYDAPSSLPRVRTRQREFATTSRFTMPLLQLTQVTDLGNGHYISGYAGMLESMYGGVGTEWFYRPWQQRLAWGIDVNHVRQRDFRQNFSFRDYTVNTGHASMYWDTGWNDLKVKLSAGRYLAGDIGATLDIKRVFPNGVAAGLWATKTNVSSQTFGEGSFDKGIYVTIPFDVMLPKSTSAIGTIVWNPLTRDGGARLNRAFTLDDLTRQRDYKTLTLRSARPINASSAENNSYVLSGAAPNMLESLGQTTTTLGQQISDIPTSTWLWAGGAILASSLLDKPVDRWAQKNQTGTVNKLGTAANTLPVAMALGAGVLFTGIGGQPAASTAETALQAAGYTYGANLLTRFVVGRSRPTKEQGFADFKGFSSGAAQSGFASNHVAIAFALATPFAQQHNMPWLYAVAAATSFGRVQKRDHWVSDTVAGAFMGYAIGSLLTNQQQQKPTDMRLSITPQSVIANWAF